MKTAQELYGDTTKKIPTPPQTQKKKNWAFLTKLATRKLWSKNCVTIFGEDSTLVQQYSHKCISHLGLPMVNKQHLFLFVI